jgi:hypothetical protein
MNPDGRETVQIPAQEIGDDLTRLDEAIAAVSAAFVR